MHVLFSFFLQLKDMHDLEVKPGQLLAHLFLWPGQRPHSRIPVPPEETSSCIIAAAFSLSLLLMAAATRDPRPEDTEKTSQRKYYSMKDERSSIGVYTREPFLDFSYLLTRGFINEGRIDSLEKRIDK